MSALARSNKLKHTAQRHTHSHRKGTCFPLKTSVWLKDSGVALLLLGYKILYIYIYITSKQRGEQATLPSIAHRFPQTARSFLGQLTSKDVTYKKLVAERRGAERTGREGVDGVKGKKTGGKNKDRQERDTHLLFIRRFYNHGLIACRQR